MKSRLLILQQGDLYNPGSFLGDLAEQLSIEVHMADSGRKDLPQSSDFDALIVTGRPPCLNKEGRSHSSEMEKQFLQAWLELDKPVLAFGSGHRLLAEAFRAGVGPNFMTSAGFVEGFLTHNGRKHPLFVEMGPTISLFKWYNQSMETPVPQNCILLATSSECVVEAFTIKGRPHIIGLQCDNHAAHPDDVRRWMENLPPERISGRVLLDQAEKFLKTNQEIFVKLIANFMLFTKR